jgi:hypothetical protein
MAEDNCFTTSCDARKASGAFLALSLINRVLDVSGEVWYEGEARNLFARSCMPELVGITYDPFTISDYYCILELFPFEYEILYCVL